MVRALGECAAREKIGGKEELIRAFALAHKMAVEAVAKAQRQYIAGIAPWALWPPFVLFVIGSALYRAFSGFSRKW